MRTHVVVAIILTFFTLAVVRPVWAQESLTPAAESETTEDEESIVKQRINDLKERLATRVAELQMINKRAFYGILKDKSDTKFTLSHKEITQPVATDIETVFYTQDADGDREETAFDSLDPGETLVVFGTLDIDQKTIIAQTVVSQELPTAYVGTVTEVDTSAGTFTLKNSESTIFDYEISTKCSIYLGTETDTCGLSTIGEGDRALVRALPDSSNLNQAKALRILVVPKRVFAPNPTTAPTEVLETDESEEVTP